MQRHSGSWRTETLAREGKIPPDSWRDWAEKGSAVSRPKTAHSIERIIMKQTGIVSTYFPNKGYGFILADVDRASRFFHVNHAVKNYHPRVGDRVQFTLDAPVRLGQPDQAVDVAPQGGATPKAGS